MTDTETVTIRRAPLARLMSVFSTAPWNRIDHPDVAEAWSCVSADLEAEGTQEPPPGEYARADGQFLEIAFMGHVELIGYVTEITLGGEPGYHIDLPEKLWGGNPLAWEEYSAKALYSRRPVTEVSVRAVWDAQVRRAAERRQQEAEWDRQQQHRAVAGADLRELPAGDEFAGGRADETAVF